MEKILKLLGIENLDESKQSELKEKFEEIVEIKAKELAIEKETLLKEELEETYSNKFEDYKKEITEQFSDFVDDVLNEEMEIPEKIVEYARKGELYEEVMETLKTKIAIDEGHIDDDVKGLLKECKDKIETLEDKQNDLIKENMELKKDTKDFAASLYIQEKCDGLPLQKKEKVAKILEGIHDMTEIDSKFDMVMNTLNEDNDKDEDKDKNGDGKILNEDKDDPIISDNPAMNFFMQELAKTA